MPSTIHVPVQSMSTDVPPTSSSLPPVQPPAEQEVIETPHHVAGLDSNILEIQGDNPSVVKQYGK